MSPLPKRPTDGAASSPIVIAYPERPTCGIWPASERIAVTVFDGDGRLHRIWMELVDESDAWNSLTALEHQFGLDLVLVIPEPRALLSTLTCAARARGITVFVAPGLLVQSIGSVALSRPRPHHLAGILARLPDSPYRTHLRTLPPVDPRQLALFPGP